MRNVPAEHWLTWKTGQFVGTDIPVTRATLQRSVVNNYDGHWRSLIFDQNIEQLEIPNILQVNIDSRSSTDAAEMTMIIGNVTAPSASDNLDLTHSGVSPSASAGPSVRDLKDLGFPGYYTYNRGVTLQSAPLWGHDIDFTWMDAFIPNRVIRTWQGYGTDGAASPWNDAKLTMTGMWLIDTVDHQATGTIVIKCRDLAKLLIEQRLYPPIVPLDKYPVGIWSDHQKEIFNTAPPPTETVPVPGEGSFGANVARHPSWDYSSSSAYYFSDKNDRGSCNHNPSAPFDLDHSTYWLSVANSNRTALWAMEWIEADCGGNPVNYVQFWMRLAGAQTCYVSVMEGGVWQGTQTIPYEGGGVGINNADIPYVLQATTVTGPAWTALDLPQMYAAERVRLTFWQMTNTTECSTPFANNYRVAINTFQCFAFTAPEAEPEVPVEDAIDAGSTFEFVPGNIRDYTDIVKLFTAWAGFYWPEGSPDDWVITNWSSLGGRAWGDFEYTGAYPVEPPEIPASYWDNKSVMDAINQLREIVGFIFYIDSTGGVVWRSPNIWKKGNFVTGVGYVDGEDTVETISENNVLIDYGVTLNDESLRSEIVIVGADPGTDLWASIRPGYAIGENVPEAGTMSDARLLGGQERVTIIPNYPFATEYELQKFGYLLTLWMHWSYRRSRFRIPGNAAFEPDDQVRIEERVTSEAYVHYIEGVSSQMDLVSGTWYMDIDTHWLGESPTQEWVIDYNDMAENSPALYAYLLASGRLSTDDTGVVYEEPTLPDMPAYEWPRIDPDDSMFPDPITIEPEDPDYESESPADNVGTGERGSYSWTTAYWGTRCASQQQTRLITAGDHVNQSDTINITTHSKLVTARVWYGFREVVKDLNLEIHGDRVGCFACRKIAGTSKWSNHAWGIAIDINHYLDAGWGFYYKDNGIWYSSGGTSYGASPPAAASGASSLNSSLTSRLKCNGIPVFRWGGNWTNVKDYMHYEVIVTPEELSTYGVKLDGVGIT